MTFRDWQQSGPLTAGEARTLAAIITGHADPEEVAGFAIVVQLCTGDGEDHTHTLVTTTDIDDDTQLIIMLASACNRVNRAKRFRE